MGCLKDNKSRGHPYGSSIFIFIIDLRNLRLSKHYDESESKMFPLLQ